MSLTENRHHHRAISELEALSLNSARVLFRLSDRIKKREKVLSITAGEATINDQ